MRLPVTIALASLVAACASTRQDAARELLGAPQSERPATRAQIPEGEMSAFLRRAVLVLNAEGHRVAARSPTQIVTTPREVDALCGSLACRAREVAMIHVSGRTVRLQLVRAVWSAAEGAWRMGLYPDDEAETALREIHLLQAMIGGDRGRVAVSLR